MALPPEFQNFMVPVMDIALIAGSVLAVAASLASVYVLIKAVHVVLLFLNGGVDAYRAAYQVKLFEKRFKLEKRRRAYWDRHRERKMKMWRMENRYRLWRHERLKEEKQIRLF
jgi:hypothetical protein